MRAADIFSPSFLHFIMRKVAKNFAKLQFLAEKRIEGYNNRGNI